MHKCTKCGFVGSAALLKAGLCPECGGQVKALSTYEPTVQDVKKSIDDLGSAVDAFKKAHAKQEEEIIANGKSTAETNAKVELIIEDLLKNQEEMQVIKAAMDNPGMQTDPAEEDAKLKKAFDDFYRKGHMMAGSESMKRVNEYGQALISKGLTESISPTAGFLVRPEQSNEIIKGVNERSPIRTIANVKTIGTNVWEGPKRTAQFAAVWVSETGTRPETAGLAYGIERITANELQAMVPVTNALLEDAFVNIESELNMEFSEQFALAEGTAFVSGSSIGRPEGFTVNAAVLAAATTSATNDLIAADDYRELLYNQLKEPYHANSTWVMHRTTMGATMKLKDGQGQYLWQPGMTIGVPSAILGRPFILATDMPVIANGAEALALGDFRRGYVIVDRVGLMIKRVEDTVTIDEGGVRFYARRRTGGQVVLAEAIKLLTIQ